MKETPILFSGPMVRAILDGRKTQTRRLAKERGALQPGHVWRDCECREIDPQDTPCLTCAARFGAPYGMSGDVLWVRETWCVGKTFDNISPCELPKPTAKDILAVDYAADSNRIWSESDRGRWRPSIHMPRWASRLKLVIATARVERLQDITEEDAIAEGISPGSQGLKDKISPVGRFMFLWESINAERCPWQSNPWVWRIDFRIVQPYPHLKSDHE